MTGRYVVDLQEADEAGRALVGGKGASLGGLSRIGGTDAPGGSREPGSRAPGGHEQMGSREPGGSRAPGGSPDQEGSPEQKGSPEPEAFLVPGGFCVTTDAYRRIVAEVPSVDGLVDRLERLSRLSRPAPDDREEIRTLSARMRRAVEEVPVPADIAAAIAGAVARHGERNGERNAFAVRSSATAEDLPTASFAGQQDSYLDVVGPEAVLRYVKRCWASLFTERAVLYRGRNGLGHRTVHMAVVVQRMVRPYAAGVLFTADPVTGDRRTATVEAVPGLGEALVSGTVNPDVFTVRDGAVVSRTAAARRHGQRQEQDEKQKQEQEPDPKPEQPTLADAQAVRLVRIGRRIEAHFGRPQDIEWCLADGDFHIVQSRPVTTLFPVPESDDGENHVYVSVGHQQMMTDPMKPLGLSMWRLTAMTEMHEAGGRLFVDVTPRLASPVSRAGLLYHMEKGDPLVRDALETVLARGDFLPTLPDADAPAPLFGGTDGSAETDPSVVAELIERSRESVAALERDIRTKSGPALFDFLLEAFEEQKRDLGDPLNVQAIATAMESTWRLNDTLHEWLGEKNAADTLTLSAPGNITSEMGRALLDVADVIRPHREVVAFLRDVDGEDEDFLDRLPGLPGGAEARAAVEGFLDRYGMRCVGEIDITRPRWSERPATLVPVLLDNVRNFEPGAAARHFEQGRRRAQQKEQDVLARLRALPDGDRKAGETKRMIDRVRTFIGYREYPKYGIVSRSFVYKQALLKEAGRLVRAGVLPAREDVFYLTFQELRDVVRTQTADAGLIRRRRAEFRSYHALTPPRVLTSDGEALTGAYRRDDVPEGALTGVPVSAGTVEGRARVVLDMAEAELEAGDILVTAFTDPSWSPLFIGIAGLVTEVGGQMTHGAVIAREYGLPAVVGVEGATRLIRDGRRIRVHGTDGYVELLD